MSPRYTPVGSAFYIGNRWPVYIGVCMCVCLSLSLCSHKSDHWSRRLPIDYRFAGDDDDHDDDDPMTGFFFIFIVVVVCWRVEDGGGFIIVGV